MLLRRILVTASLPALFALALPTAAPAASSGTVRLVGPGRPYTTIQAAVGASADGDTIRVDPGIYNESVVIEGKQRLTLLGRSLEGTRIIGTTGHALEIKGSFATLASADDVVDTDANKITSGANGICNTSATSPDTQAIPLGQGDPDTDCVLPGPNAALDTSNSGDDQIVGTKITSGSNGICQSTQAGDDVQAIPVGEGRPNGGCVEGGKRSRDVKIQNFMLRAPDGFDGVNVSRTDFVILDSLVLDAGTHVFSGVCTGPGTPYTCCTGAGVGKCEAIDACTAANVPFTCCAGKGTGSCASNNTCTAAGTPLSCCTGNNAGTCADTTGWNGIFVNATAIKPLVKSCIAKRQPASGFFIEGPGAEVTGCTAESNSVYGFASSRFSDSAIYTSNIAKGNLYGFGIGGQGNIVQRCTAASNASIGFHVVGIGNILYQVTAAQNGPASTAGIGIMSIGEGTRIRSSTITGNSNFGIFLARDPTGTAEGSEVFASVVRDNRNGGIVNEAFGVVMKQNTVGPLGSNRQDVGILLRDQAQGTLLEGNRIVNNRDTDGGVCAAGALCDLVNQGLHNAGKTNQFTPGFTPPPGFQ